MKTLLFGLCGVCQCVHLNVVSFLPRDDRPMHSAVLVIVSLSVRLSVTLVDCVHMVRPTIMVSLPYGSPIILVSADITIIPKFEGGDAERGYEGAVGTNWRFSTFKPRYLRNGARYNKGYY